MRAQLEERWGILATENYGMSELIGPGVSGECVHKAGMHINEDFHTRDNKPGHGRSAAMG